MSDWVKELQSYRNLTVSNFDNTESILLRFSDQSYESSQKYYPLTEQGTALYAIDKKINDTVLIPIEMIENVESTGLELKDNQE